MWTPTNSITHTKIFNVNWIEIGSCEPALRNFLGSQKNIKTKLPYVSHNWCFVHSGCKLHWNPAFFQSSPSPTTSWHDQNKLLTRTDWHCHIVPSWLHLQMRVKRGKSLHLQKLILDSRWTHFFRCEKNTSPYPQFNFFLLRMFASTVTAHSERSLKHFSLIPESNTVFWFEARFYHSAFTKQSNYAAIIRDHS